MIDWLIDFICQAVSQYIDNKKPRSLKPISTARGQSPTSLTNSINWLIDRMIDFFSALHGMQARTRDEKGPFVCPSVKGVDCDKTEERFVQIFIPYERSFNLVFWEEEWLMGGDPSTWNFGSTGPLGAKSPIFSRYSLLAPRLLFNCLLNGPASLNILYAIWTLAIIDAHA